MAGAASSEGRGKPNNGAVDGTVAVSPGPMGAVGIGSTARATSVAAGGSCRIRAGVRAVAGRCADGVNGGKGPKP